MLLASFFVCSLLFVSCKNQGQGKKGGKHGEDAKPDPELKLVKLKIFGNELNDLENMEIEVSEDVIDIENITAWFDYGDVKEEAIGVTINGKETFDVGSAEFMMLSVPEVKTRYKAWSGKVKVIHVQKEMSLMVGWDYQNQNSGTEETFGAETLCFSVVAEEDIIQSAILNYDGRDVDMPVREEITGPKTYWVASRIDLLPIDEPKDYKIIVKPKDSKEYKDTVVSYRLKGTQVPKNNAEFVYATEDEADVSVDLKWKDKCESTVPQDYGVSSISVSCRTVSPRAKVMAKIVNPNDENKIIGREVALTCTDRNGVHTGEVLLLQDAPSQVVLYVVAEDGSTKNNTRGTWKAMYNPMDLYWSYKTDDIATAELRKNKNAEYASIDVTKTDVQNNTIHLVFVTWAKEFGFAPKDASNYTELDTFSVDEASQTAYRLDVDVSTLNAGEKKDVVFTIEKNKDINGDDLNPPVEAASYRVAINMK